MRWYGMMLLLVDGIPGKFQVQVDPVSHQLDYLPAQKGVDSDDKRSTFRAIVTTTALPAVGVCTRHCQVEASTS